MQKLYQLDVCSHCFLIADLKMMRPPSAYAGGQNAHRGRGRLALPQSAMGVLLPGGGWKEKGWKGLQNGGVLINEAFVAARVLMGSTPQGGVNLWVWRGSVPKTEK